MALAASLRCSSCICFDAPLADSNSDRYKSSSINFPLRLRIHESSKKPLLVSISTSTIVFVGLSLCICSSASALTPLPRRLEKESQTADSRSAAVEEEDEKSDAAFEVWKSKSFALTVSLSMVALQGSMPPSWSKDFISSQSRRLKFQAKFRPSLEDIFAQLCLPFTPAKGKVNIGPASTAAADIVTLGDSWLSFAIRKAVIEPITAAEHLDWFKDLSHKWKVYLRRNLNGDIDPQGQVWAAPYRWGTMVIAYKKTKFQKQKLPPIQDWADLWRPELAGRISMVNSPREVVGAVLKYMGASYNTMDIDLQVPGGRNAVLQNLELLAKQVNFFDSANYLRAFSVGDVWVAVGWSSDVLPVAKRMSNVAVIVPKSGASLWADLWVIPAASGLKTDRIGGRVRGPSPLIHQWVEFCLQTANSLPFRQGVTAGASPSALVSGPLKLPEELTKGKPKLDTNIVAGAPPLEILERCEFLEPLSDATLLDYEWLIKNMPKCGPNFIEYVSSLVGTLRKPKLT
ncbi:Leucine-rich repeat protein kinase family protein isoform 1 [Hibiscus syriacus]|uniref:Leucine-rich repeat protein kinase family protein isoform 1 n=1 Tax=Hibiscus syriacus TaxID=106335 RepID=A0A6A2YJI0_HIBSY|nr:uncharacterized protein LOC120164265 isoform X1 [Hibiscus syriacus]KAE8677497.1 Leucine-rich repeat protein kinase family protein isoform 1 [Hibiscus syriacus]